MNVKSIPPKRSNHQNSPEIIELMHELENATLAKDREKEIYIFLLLAKAYIGIHEFASASLMAETSLELAQKIEHKEFELSSLEMLGLLYTKSTRDTTKIVKGVDYLRQAVSLVREMGDEKRMALALGNLAMTYSEHGKIEEAIALLEEALIIDRKYGLQRGESTRLGNLGSLYRDMHQFEVAIKYQNEALAIDREIGARDGELIRVGNLGLIYMDLHQPETALSYFEQAVQIAKEIGQRRREGKYLGEMGHAYFELNQKERARTLFQEALKISEDIQDIQNIAICAAFLVDLYQKEDLHKAANYMDIVVSNEKLLGSSDIENKERYAQHLHNLANQQTKPSLSQKIIKLFKNNS